MTQIHRPDERVNLAAAVALSPDGVVLVDELGVVTYANPAFLAMIGLVGDEVVGRPIDDVASRLIGPTLVADLQQAVLADRLWRQAVDVRRTDGTPGSLEVTATPIPGERSPTAYLVSVRDNTPLREAEARLERRRGLGQAVTEVARVLLRHTRPDEIAREACRALVEAGDIAMAWVGLLDGETRRVVPIGSFGDTGYLDSVVITADLTPRGRGPVGHALRTGEPVIVGDIDTSTMMEPWRDTARRHGYRSVAAIPLQAHETLSGVLVTYAAQPAAFSPDNLDLFAQLAADVAFAFAVAKDSERRHQLEVALRSSERRLAEALEDLSLVAMMLAPDGTVLFANRHLLELTGWERAEVVGQDWFERFIPPEDRGAGRAAYVEALARGTIIPNWSAPLVTRSGERRQMEWSSAFSRDETESVVGLVTVALDITAREADRAALEDSETRLRAAFDAMLDGVTVVSAIRDDAGRITDFRTDYANRAISEMSRIAARDQVGHSLLERLPALRATGLLDAYVRVVETGQPYRSGPVHYVDPDAAGGPLDQIVEHSAAKMGDGYVLSVRDVTKQIRAEAELRRLWTAIEQSADAVVITDANAAIEYVNPAFERVSGYTSAEVVGQNPRVLMSGVQAPAFYAAMWETLSSGATFVGDLVNRSKDGSLFTEEAVISPVRGEDGTIRSYVAVKRDVTRERAAEAARERDARQRALISKALNELAVLPSLEATAASICRQVLGLEVLNSANVNYFTAERRVAPLAFVTADGRDVALRRLPGGRSRTLMERASEGPWIEAWIPRPRHPYDRLFRDLGVSAVAHAPVSHAGGTLGLLTVTAAAPDGVARLAETVPALVEFASIAGALVGPGIEELVGIGGIRARVTETIRALAFRPVFQPIVDVANGAHVGYEALTRFTSGMPPDAVFAEARMAGFGAGLEMATLEAAVTAAASLPEGAWLSLNVGPDLVGDSRLRRLLRRVDRPVVIEVTEHTPVADYAGLRASLGRFRPRVRVAVDDAGAGITNFNHIVELRPAFVKLDISLVRGVDADRTRQALVLGLQQFAERAGSETIAEGVETEEELAMIRDLGVRFVQGYLLARPAPVDVWTVERGELPNGPA